MWIEKFPDCKNLEFEFIPQMWPLLRRLVDSMHICSWLWKERKKSCSKENFSEKCNIDFHSKNDVISKSLICQISNGIEQQNKKKAVVFLFVLFSWNCDFSTSECYNVPMWEANAVWIWSCVKTNQQPTHKCFHRHCIKKNLCLLTQISFFREEISLRMKRQVNWFVIFLKLACLKQTLIASNFCY